MCRHARQQRQARGVDGNRHAAGPCHLGRVADESEAGDVGGAVDGARELPQHIGARLVQHRHRGHRTCHECVRCMPLLDRGADDTGAEPLGENQPIAGARAGVGPDAIGIDRAGHGVAELHLGITYRVAAQKRNTGFAQLVVTAKEDLLDGLGVQDLVGKPGDGQRRHGRAAHRIDVAERVGGGDLSVGKRVVDDGGEEVHCLHERGAGARPPVHPASSEVLKSISTPRSVCGGRSLNT